MLQNTHKFPKISNVSQGRGCRVPLATPPIPFGPPKKILKVPFAPPKKILKIPFGPPQEISEMTPLLG